MIPTPDRCKAQDDLDLFFADAGGIWGLRASPFEGGGVSVWDDKRSALEHGRRWISEMLGDYDRIRRVTAEVACLRAEQPAAWQTACVVHTPRRWPKPVVDVVDCRQRRGSLVGLLLFSTKLRTAHKRQRPRENGTPLELLAFARDRAGKDHQLFRDVRVEAEESYAGALAAYMKVRARERRRIAA